MQLKTTYRELGGGLDMSSLPKSKSHTLPAKFRGMYFYSVLQALLETCRSLGGHMVFSMQIHAAENRAVRDLLPRELEEFLISGPSEFRQACIQGIQQLQEKYPFLTYPQLLIMTDALKIGLDIGGRFYSGHNPLDNKCSSEHSKGGNSMPPQSTQQDSKRDL